MKKILATVSVGLLVGLLSVQAPDVGVREAGADEFGFGVLKCFHPTATYTGSTLGTAYRDGDGRTAQNGHIDFRGGITSTPYALNYVMHWRNDGGDHLSRVTVTSDSAPFVPAADCYMRNWWRRN